MNKKFLVSALCAWSLLLPCRGFAATQAIGKVVQCEGNCSRVEGAKTAPIKAGDSFSEGDLLRTGADSRMVLRLGDDAALMMKPGSEMRVKKTPAHDWRAELGRGAAMFRVKPQSKPDHLMVRTRAAVMGVRGTTFFIEDRGNEPIFFCTCNGTVAVKGTESGKEVVVKGTHHNAPKFIDAGSSEIAQRMVIPKELKDPHHTDEDVELLGRVIEGKAL